MTKSTICAEKSIIFLIALLVSTIAASAAWIEPLDCSILFYEEGLVPKTGFGEPADICFYGSGFEPGNADLMLDGVNDYFLGDVPISNGVLSSAYSLEFFSVVPEGTYVLTVLKRDEIIEYSLNITVFGDYESEQDSEAIEVPEFSVLAAGLALAGAGLYIHKKRKRMLK